jgi:hypothetical protein
LKIHKLIAVLFALPVLGCSSLSTQFKAAAEPAEGDRARLRVIANVLVKAVPNKSCIDWDSPGAGTVFGGIFGSSGYRGRTLNIPALNANKNDMGEMYVSADKPITLVMMTTPEGVGYKGRLYSCSVSGSFIPQKDRDYEAKLLIDPQKDRCSIEVMEIGAVNVPVIVHQAEMCQ